MAEHFWFEIEGDNGAGKTTLADRLMADGWFLASRTPQAVAEATRASSLRGVDRVGAFLAYNQMCGELASAHPKPSFLVRYWPSTLAASFADKIFDWPEIEGRIQHILR